MSLDKNQNLANEICKIEIAKSNIVSNVKVGSTENHRQVEFSSGGWEEIYFTPGTAKFSSSPKDMAAGTIYNQKLNCFYPGCDETSLPEVKKYTSQPIIIRLTYSCGSVRLFGDLNDPVKLLPSYTIGGKSGRMFDFKRQSTEEIYIYED